MAKVGLAYMVCAPIVEDLENKTVTYNEGMVMSKAIKSDVKIDINDAKLFGDNMMIEQIKAFKGGTLSLNGDEFSNAVKALILGHKITSISGPPAGEMLTAFGDDDGKFVGVGFYSDVIRGGVYKYRAVWMRKVKFGEPGDTSETKGESINFKTPTIEGSISRDVTGAWKNEATFDKEADAIAWLNQQAQIQG